jgi:hypothetical protein
VPDHDPLTDGLQALARLGAPQPDVTALRGRAAPARAAAPAADRANATPRRRRRPLRWPSGTVALALLSVTVTAAVIAVALIALSNHPAAPDRPAGSPASTVSPPPARLPSRPTRRLLIREDSRERHRAPARLLSAFTALRGSVPRTSGDATVSHPRLSATPTQILELASPRRRNHIAVDRIREVALRSGIDVWILPGSRSLCTAVAAPVPGQGTPVWGYVCAAAGPAARKQGNLGIEHGPKGVIAWLLPTSNPTITVRIHGRRRTLTPALGVYAEFRHRH